MKIIGNYVFISHSNKDKDLALAICQGLENANIPCWIAPRDIPGGADYAVELVKGIKNSKAFLLLISENSDASEHVRNEIEIAMSNNIQKYGLLFDHYQMSEFLEYHFRRFQLIEASNPLTSMVIEELIKAIEKSDRKPIKQTAGNSPSNCKNNLPAPIQMIGRKTEFQQVVESLGTETQHFTILGMTGIGKKTLANQVAHTFIKDNKYEFIIWLTAEEGTLTLNSMLDQMALIFDDQFMIRLKTEDKENAALSFLQKKAVLLIINGLQKVTDDEVLRFLNRITFDDAVIVTSDVNTDIFKNSGTITLRGLSKQEVVELAHLEGKRIGLPNLEKAPDKLFHELHRLSSGNPYVIKLAIGQVKAGVPFDRVLLGLRQAHGQVFNDVFANSWSVLDEDQKELLMCLSLFWGSSSSDALQYVSGNDDWDFVEDISTLINMSLVNTNGAFLTEDIRYSILPLTRSFSRNKLEESPNKDTYLRKFIDYFSKYISNHSKRFSSLLAELENIRFMVDWVKQNDPNEHLKTIMTLYSFYRDMGYWDEAVREYNAALDPNRYETDMELELAHVHYRIVSFYLRRGSPEELDKAKTHLEIAQKVFTAHKDSEGLCATLGRKARVAQKMKDYNLALEFGLEALEIAKNNDLTLRIADLEHEIGDSYFYLENYELAEQHYKSSLDIYQSQDVIIRTVGRYNDLGRLSAKMGDFSKARELLEQAIQLAEQYNKLDTLCRAHINLAETLMNLDEMEEAKKHALTGKELAEQLTAHEEGECAAKILDKISHRK